VSTARPSHPKTTTEPPPLEQDSDPESVNGEQHSLEKEDDPAEVSLLKEQVAAAVAAAQALARKARQRSVSSMKGTRRDRTCLLLYSVFS